MENSCLLTLCSLQTLPQTVPAFLPSHFLAEPYTHLLTHSLTLLASFDSPQFMRALGAALKDQKVSTFLENYSAAVTEAVIWGNSLLDEGFLATLNETSGVRYRIGGTDSSTVRIPMQNATYLLEFLLLWANYRTNSTQSQFFPSFS